MHPALRERGWNQKTKCLHHSDKKKEHAVYIPFTSTRLADADMNTTRMMARAEAIIRVCIKKREIK